MSKSPTSVAKDGLGEGPVPHYLGHRERLRERFLDGGPDAVTEYELLELVLFRAIPRRDVKPLAKAMIARFGSFAETIAARPERLREIAGLGESAITDLKIVEAAARRLTKGAVKARRTLGSWTEVLDYCRTAMAFNDREEFRILFLDKRNMLIGDEVQGRGTVDHTPVYPREVVRRDDRVDGLHESLFRILLTHMMEDPRRIGASVGASTGISCSNRT